MIKACIFDLDGVIVDTAKYHFKAWREMASAIGIDFTEIDNEELKGVGRMESLDFILSLGNVEKPMHEKQKLAYAKNQQYKSLISNISKDEILPGVLKFLDLLKQNNIKIALGSSSKNAQTILVTLNIDHYFDVIIDGTNTTKSKPDPQVFNLGADALGIPAENIVVFEDAVKGVEAALSGNFLTIGVGEKDILKKAHFVIPGFEYFTIDTLRNMFNCV